MRYMLMMHAPRGTGDYQIGSWSPDDFKAHLAFMHQLDRDLTESGEWVDGQGLTPPGEARLVRADRGGTPVTDGPFSEAKEFLAGFWIVEVDRPERAHEIAARTSAAPGPAGELIPLEEQDRTRRNQRLIAEGIALVSSALARGPVGPYQLQAAIAALHDEAARVEDTDWPQILALYDVLERMSDNPMVSLSRAVAAAMVHGPAAGLELLRALDADARLRGHHRLDAVRAHLLERADDCESAAAHYRAAAERTRSIPERDYLLTRAARLAAPGRTPDAPA